MDCKANKLFYRQTNYFSKIVLDYLDQAKSLEPFYNFPSTIDGISKKIEQRKSLPVNRKLLVEELRKQYNGIQTDSKVNRNIESLLSENTFTITTAHQPNIFTGPLYFLYKILHAIKLSDYLNETLPGNKFVPVYYMGNEDADLDELGHIYLDGERIDWATNQTGAVGRMKVDKDLLKIIEKMEGQLGVESYGKEVIELVKESYKEGNTIQFSTLSIVNELFGKYGLVVIIPDTASLKSRMIDIFKDDLLQQQPSAIVGNTSAKLAELYKVQAYPREINLFYLKDNIRERIEIKDGKYEVLNIGISFTKEEMLAELNDYPDRFSPNVILRGLFQEAILPNIVFIGGGGELAYWLQLKELFNHYHISYPVLLLRNSFLLVEEKWRKKISKMGFTSADFFLPEQDLLNKLVERDSNNETKLNGSLIRIEELYNHFKNQAAEIDSTLAPHVDALKTKSLQQLRELEKKMLRAEKRKFAEQQRHIQVIREKLFPNNGLQERYDNFSFYYAKWGRNLIDLLYKYSLALENKFVIIEEVGE